MMRKLLRPIEAALAPVHDRWARFSDRERRMIALLLFAFLLTFAVIGFNAARRSIAARESSIAAKRTALMKVALLAEGYREAAAARARIESRIKGTPVRLYSYLEDLAQKQNVKIGDMQDRSSASAGEGIERSTVEVNFASIDLPSLTAFLNQVEKSPQLVKLERLRLRSRNDNPDLIDASLTVSTYHLTES